MASSELHLVHVFSSDDFPLLLDVSVPPQFRCGADQVLATGPGNPAAVRIRIPTRVWFGSRTIQIPGPQRRGWPNPNPYPSSRGFCRVWLDLSVTISGSVFRVLLFMAAFRYPIADRKIVIFAGNYPFRMNQPPLSLTPRDTRSMPHPEHDSHQCVNDFCSSFRRHLGGDWMQTIINEVLAVFQTKTDCYTLPAPF